MVKSGFTVLPEDFISKFPEKMVKAAQVLSNLNENFFEFFVIKKFCGSRIALGRGC
jgi:hypothetical protein